MSLVHFPNLKKHGIRPILAVELLCPRYKQDIKTPGHQPQFPSMVQSDSSRLSILVSALAFPPLLLELCLSLLSLSALLGDHLTQVIVICPLGSDALFLPTLLELAPQVVFADTIVVVQRVDIKSNVDVARLLALA
ncbi:hypothetical protein NW765_010852 [Fusarium oxysporum]|nr:hypothetical protein NW765_010852 [Fusarium oxysporum]